MKESTYCHIIALTLVLYSFFTDDSARALMTIMVGISFILAATICRAIEKNGREK